jgi:type II secretory pathway component PulK
MRELLQVRGMTPSLFAHLEEFVAVLPSNDFKVNVNTAPTEVIAALSDGLYADRGVVDRLIATRREAAFTSPTAVGPEVSGWPEAIGGPESGAHPGGADYVATASDFFLIYAVSHLYDVRRRLVAVVKRDGTLRAKITRVIWSLITVDLSLTSQPPSDFLQSLPPLGGQT